MQQCVTLRLLAPLLTVSAVCWADTVVLRSGYRLTVQSYEASDEKVRLFMPNGGWIAVLPADIDRIEPDAPEPDEEPAKASAKAASGENDALASAIERFAAEAGLPTGLVRAVIWAESGFQHSAVSPEGAIGLMQLMPETASDLGVDPYDSSQNLRGGTAYLRQMLERFEGDEDQLVKALAAYNAGPGQVAKHGGIPPFPETAAYVRRVLRHYLAETEEPPEPNVQQPPPDDENSEALPSN